MDHKIQGTPKEPWSDRRTQRDHSWPCVQKHVPFQDLSAPLGSGLTFHKSKAWKTILCPWTDDWIRKQTSLSTTRSPHSNQIAQKKVPLAAAGTCSHETKEVCERDMHAMGNPFPLEPYQ